MLKPAVRDGSRGHPRKIRSKDNRPCGLRVLIGPFYPLPPEESELSEKSAYLAGTSFAGPSRPTGLLSRSSETISAFSGTAPQRMKIRLADSLQTTLRCAAKLSKPLDSGHDAAIQMFRESADWLLLACFQQVPPKR